MNIVIFGPNGSGKGTQGAAIRKRFSIPHIETGVIFRQNITSGSDLGEKARAFLEKGELVPDEITVPMILGRLQEPDAGSGWLLDGFPRNISQAQVFWLSLCREKIALDFVIEIVLDRNTAKARIMGRRLCPIDNNHPNNIFIEEIKPILQGGRLVCRICGNPDLVTRSDDQDEAAIDKRLAIYYDARGGTIAAINFFKEKVPVLSVDGRPSVVDVSREIFSRLS